MQEIELEAKDNQPRSKPKRRFDLIGVLDIAIALVVFVVAWEAVFLLKIYPSFLFPSPVMTLGRFVMLVQSGTPQLALVTTSYRLAAGFLIAIVLGVALGSIMVVSKRFGRTMSSFGLGLQSFPSIAWVPFAILIIGLTDWGILFVMIMSSVFSIMLSTYSGIRNIPPIYTKAAKNMGSRRFALFRNVLLPGAMPSFMGGVRQAWSFAWHALVGAEILMTTVGLGSILYLGSEFARMDEIIASMITIFVIGLAADRLLFARLEKGVRARWGMTS